MNSPLNTQALTLKQQLSAAKGWEQRYRELLLIGKKAAPQPSIRTDANKVSGCQANVWCTLTNTANGFEIAADSDARLVKALLQVMIAPLQGQHLTYIAHFDFADWLAQCMLADHLSESRVNGLHQVILALKEQARLA